MRSLVPFAVAALAFAAPIAAQQPVLDTDDGGVAWLSDFAAARAQAAKEHKPLLVLFRCER